mmetsp:Transcript_56799/g.89919  ORF Transcript_56799/g.89919 Transcript_56799/m.89919 type:complete len:187 (+) Transcript_56799:2-562(+)
MPRRKIDEPCAFFKKGLCKYSNCWYRHEGAESSPGEGENLFDELLAALDMENMESMLSGDSAVSKAGGGSADGKGGFKGKGKESCRFFARNGWCQYDQNCWYLHDADPGVVKSKGKGIVVSPPSRAPRESVPEPWEQSPFTDAVWEPSPFTDAVEASPSMDADPAAKRQRIAELMSEIKKRRTMEP